MARCLLLPCLVPLLYVFAAPKPKGEKFSINTDVLYKVREQMNETTRDKTARNINFAWRVSFTRTTTLPTTAKTTLGMKDIEQNQVEYQKIFTQLAITLKDKTYRTVWTELVKKGYPHFIEQVKTGGPKVFMKNHAEGVFDGEEGTTFWNKIVAFLETMGEKGFELLLNSVDQQHLQSTTIGNPAQPEPVKTDNEAPKDESQTVQPKDSVTEAPK